MAKGNDYHKYDLARLQVEIEEERELKEMLVGSVCDLRCTVAELQERLRSVDGEGFLSSMLHRHGHQIAIHYKEDKTPKIISKKSNEWKTRFETQVELNGQLERQISHIQQRLEIIKGNPVDRLAFIRLYEDMGLEMLKEHLTILTEKKTDLHNQLKNCHLQMEQEEKAFHKTNDERRAYLTEIAMLSSVREPQRRQYANQRQRAPESKQIRGKDIHRKAQAGSNKGTEEGLTERLNEGGGGGGGDSTTERGMKKKSQRESRLPTLKHQGKHKP
ncbi:coiled-coil domain containing 169 isoform X1 [Poeciliopsis prolifica]|uniref:coiled-coil domain containing 169 isoform X1 n=1 Tax=Poeciliopsis prolifica TaxID=188132 RepID=UPI0024139B58|nr:coiled-coil domain containing 169 isoform X1 [Poeciliopsis prolifica]